MKEEYEKYCRFYGCEEKECWYNGCQCEGERLIIKEPKILYETSEVRRVEVIQHSEPYNGRAYTNYNAKEVEIQLQDDEKTLKIFLK